MEGRGKGVMTKYEQGVYYITMHNTLSAIRKYKDIMATEPEPKGKPLEEELADVARLVFEHMMGRLHSNEEKAK